MSRQTGRTLRLIKRAIDLAAKHDVVPVLVPSTMVGESITAMAKSYAHDILDGELRTTTMRRVERIKMVVVRGHHNLAGIPRLPLLADHTWHESVAWIADATQRIIETGDLP